VLTMEPDIGALDPSLLSGPELREALLAADRERSRAEARELALLAEFDARDEYKADGAVSAALWLARHGDLTRSAAGSMASDARKLRRHPESMAACSEIGTAKVREFIRRVHSRIEAAYAEDETSLLSTMRRFSVDDTIVFAKRWAAMIDQDGAEPPENTPSLTMGRTGDALHGSFSLYGEDAAFLASALTNESDRIWRCEGEEHLPAPQRNAQALMDLLRKAVGASDITTDPAKPTVVVHMALDQLEGRAGYEMATVDPYGTLIPADSIGRLLCDAKVHRILSDPNGIVLDFGYSERIVKGYQRLAVIARDRHCTFPGCDRPPAMCHAHHIVPWDDDGPTDMANLALLCHLHHHAVHKRGFGCQRLPDGTLEFTRPDGTLLEPQARPG